MTTMAHCIDGAASFTVGVGAGSQHPGTAIVERYRLGD
jgi:hypothetical protein